jgi:hypothetical protein
MNNWLRSLCFARHAESSANISGSNAEAEYKSFIYVYMEKYGPQDISLNDGYVESGRRG